MLAREHRAGARGRLAMFPRLAAFTDHGLLLMRLLVGLIFADSGWNHVRDPEGRGRSIGLSKGFTAFLGAAELLGGIGVALGVFTQLAAAGLILLMLGAIQKKVFVWRTGFWGKQAYGWHYDLMLVAMNLVILCTNGGRFVLWK
jgi:putative oxidoreductase